MKDIIILLGLPASGKGTQAAMLSEKFNYLNLSTGSLLREEIDNNTDVGKRVAGVINAGDLVPDKLMFEVLSKRMRHSSLDGFILDGFPRTVEQAEILSGYLASSNMRLKKVFVIELDEKTVLERICSRITCKKCGAIYNTINKKPKVDGVCDVCGSTDLMNRNDDLNMKAIKKRIDIFKTNIGDIMSFYEKKSLIFSIDGLKDVKAINCEMIKALNCN